MNRTLIPALRNWSGWFVALALACAAPAEVIWRLDNVRRIGGHEAEVLGQPRVVADAGGPGVAAVVFDGARDGLFVPDIPIAGAKAFTIEILFNPAEDGLEAQRFLHLQDVNAWRALIELRLNHKGGWWLDTFMFTGKPGEEGLPLIDPARVHPTGQWHWAALRYDGKVMAHFVNGVKELEGTKAFQPYAQGKISLGVRQNKVYWFKGAIREVRFHREALPAEKLQRVK